MRHQFDKTSRSGPKVSKILLVKFSNIRISVDLDRTSHCDFECCITKNLFDGHQINENEIRQNITHSVVFMYLDRHL